MEWPVKGKVTSGYGNRTHPVTGATAFHNGVDIGARHGAPIHAPLKGFVRRVWYDTKGGRCMWVDHPGGIRTGYAHCAACIIQGEIVERGDLIGYVGSTGASTGPHLHFTVRVREKLVDPMTFLEA